MIVIVISCLCEGNKTFKKSSSAFCCLQVDTAPKLRMTASSRSILFIVVLLVRRCICCFGWLSANIKIFHLFLYLYDGSQKLAVMTRKRLFEIVERGGQSDKVSLAYDILMFIAITVSIFPLMFVEEYPVFKWFEMVTVAIFILDYLFRWSTADYKLGKGALSFLLYPLTPMAIIDLLSILPGLSLISRGFKILRITRLFKVLRLFKFLRYSDKMEILWNVIKREKGVLPSGVITASYLEELRSRKRNKKE